MTNQLSGKVAVTVGGADLELGSNKAQTVFVALALAGGSPVPVEALLDREDLPAALVLWEGPPLAGGGLTPSVVRLVERYLTTTGKVHSRTRPVTVPIFLDAEACNDPGTASGVAK